MKKTLVAVIALTVILAFNQKMKLSTPEATVKAFVTAMQQSKYEEAKKHASISSIKAIDLIAAIDKKGAGTKDQIAKYAKFKASSFTLGKTTINEKQAVTTVIFTTDQKNDTNTIATSTENTNWKVNFSK
jgi:hypothetical protein